MLFLPGAALAQSLPTGGRVMAGSAHIGTASNGSLAITQSSSRAVINWQGFSVGAGNSVTFNQPNASSATLNRVTGAAASSLAGSINANGKVYLVNPNGIQITSSGAVDAKGGFIASTLGMSDSDFLHGTDRFAGSGNSAAVVNQGNITTGPGGAVALIGSSVANSGTIITPLGKVALGAGQAATLDINGDGFLQVELPSGATDASGKPLVSNSGTISADGGSVELKAATVRDAIRDSVNMSGNIQARSVSGHDGDVVLGGGGGTVVVSGTVDASGAERGGRIDVSGGNVALRGAVLNASGSQRGGLVRVGGAFQGGKAQDPASAKAQKYVTRFGASPAIANANTTSIDAASKIDVSATGADGAGGTAIVWSNLDTSELGSIDAHGAAVGGAVEVSSHNAVQSIALGHIETGAGGTLLLDPKNINIEDDPGNGSITFDGAQNYTFADDTGGTLTLSTQAIMSVLSAGTDLDLQASNDITWTSTTGGAATSSSGPIGHLTLDAGRSVIFNVTDAQLTFLDGSVTIIANDTAAAGVVDADRASGAASISMLADPGAPSGLTAIINGGYDNTTLAPSSYLTVELRDGAGNTYNQVGNLSISQAFFSDVTLSAVPAAQIQFYNQDFDVRNLTITGNIQNGQGSILSLIGDNSVDWTNEFTSTITTIGGSTLSFSLGTDAVTNLVGLIQDGDSDAIRLDLQPDSDYTAVYGEAIPSTAHSLTATIDPNSAIQSFASGDDSTSIMRSRAFSPFWAAANQGSPVGTYYGQMSAGGSMINSSVHGSYLVDVTSIFSTPPVLDITQRPVVVTANDSGGYTYGQPPGTMAVTLSQDGGNGTGILSGDTVVPVVSFSGTSGTQDMVDVSGTTGNPGDYGFDIHAPAGGHTYTITALDGGSAGNYMIDTAGSTLTANLSISPALLVPSLSAGSYTYGSPDPLVSLSGVVSGDSVAPIATISGIGGSQTMTDTGGGNYAFDAHTAVGTRTYTLTGIGGTDGGNYELDTSGTISDSLVIAPKTITYATCCSDQISTYGTAPSFDLSLSGVLTGDDVSANVSATGSSGTVTLGARTPAGAYTISTTGLSGAEAGDYTLSGASDFTLTVNPLALGYTGPGGSVQYGTSFGGIVTLTGVLAGDDVSAALGVRSGGVTNDYTVQTDAGTYQTVPGTLSGANAGDYTVGGGTPGTLVISPVALNYVLHDETMDYGTGTAPQVDLTGVLFGDDVSAAVSTNAPGGLSLTTNVGTYTASVGGLAGTKAGDYTLGTGNASSTITINPKPLGLSSTSSTTTYGSVTAPSTAVTLTGLVTTGDAIAIHPQLTIMDSFGNTVAAASTDSTTYLGETLATTASNLDAGTYTVTVALSTNDSSHPISNYSLPSTSAQAITVNKAPLTATITDSSYSWTYGSQVEIGVSINLTGFASGEGGIGRVSMFDGSGNPVSLTNACCGTNAPGQIVAAGLDAGTYTVSTTDFTPLGAAKTSNYYIASTNTIDATITPKPLTYVVNNASSTYGTVASLSASLNGVFGSDDVSVAGYSLTDVNNQSVTLGDRLTGGTYTVNATTLGGTAASNYSIATSGNTAGTLTVNPKLITWSISDTSAVYGSANALYDMGTVSFDGLLSGDSLGATTAYFINSDEPYSYHPPITIGQSTTAGTYKMFVTGLTGTNAMLHDYKIDPNAANTPGILTVDPEPITVTMQDATLAYGTPFIAPGYGVTSGVLYNGDQVTLDGYSYNLGNGDVGTYALTGKAHVNSNYTVTVTPGTITIVPLQLTYNVADLSWIYGDYDAAELAALNPSVSFAKVSDSSAYYGVPTGDVTLSYLGNGTPVTLTQHSNVGTYSIVPSVSSPDFSLVASGSQDGTVTITPRTLYLGSATGVYGDRPGFSISNVLAGDSVSVYDATLTGTLGSYDMSLIWNTDGSFRGNPDPPPVDSYSVGNVLLSGTNTFDYTLAPTTGVTYTITPRPITIASMAPVTAAYGDSQTQAGYQLGDFIVQDGLIDSPPIFTGNVTYNNLVVAGDADAIEPAMQPFSTLQNVGAYQWQVDQLQPHLLAVRSISGSGARTDFSCTTVGCMNFNYTLVGGGTSTVTLNPKLLTYTIDNASGIYGSTNVTAQLSGIVPSDATSGAVYPVLGVYTPVYYEKEGTIAVNGSVSYGSSAVSFTQSAGRVPAGQSVLLLDGVGGTEAANYTFVPSTANDATLTITPKTVTYTTIGGTAYSGVGGIAGSLDNLGDYTLSGVLSGDNVGAVVQIKNSYGALWNISEAGFVTAGTYSVVITSLTGSAGGDYTLDTADSTPGTLTSVNLQSLNGLSFLGNDDAGSTILSIADISRSASKNGGSNFDSTASVDLTGVTDLITGQSPPSESSATNTVAGSNGGGSSTNDTSMQTGTNTGTDTSIYNGSSPSSDCSQSVDCILNTKVGESATGGASAQACAAGMVCISGGASYGATNEVHDGGASASDTVSAGTTVSGQESTAAGTLNQTAHADVSIGVTAAGGLFAQPNGVTLAANASAIGGVTVYAGDGISGEYGSVDTQVGTSVGSVGAGGSIGASYSNGTVSFNISGSLDVGIGLDISLSVSINFDAVGDALMGYNTSYVAFDDPEAAQTREDTGLQFVQQAQRLQQQEQDFVSNVLQGNYNSDPSAIADYAASYKSQEAEIENAAAEQGFTVSPGPNGSFNLTDNNPPPTHTVDVHHEGLFEAFAGLF
ncbi:MAG: filamentous hemagglutinin N-terminal domain-containing protein [Alphaproteobacteria bacterium]|nr:filamentous hemagglutinin N-terminal domain-containing protein [Alphaproteobacteria bacterium]